MLYPIGYTFRDIQLFLANPAEDLPGHDLDRYVLLERSCKENVENRDTIFRPHELAQLYGREMLAGNLVLGWLHESGNDVDKARAVRSFFGWDTTELSANQKLFVAEAEERGCEVDYDYVPKNSYGQICPAIYVGFEPYSPRQLYIDFDEPNYGTGFNAVCEVDSDEEFLFARA